MKKGIAFVLLLMMLTGCGTEPEFETMGNIQYEPEVIPQAGYISVMIPAAAAEEVMADSTLGKRFTWDQNEIRLETLEAGDLARTLRMITGMDPEKLTVISQKRDGMNTWQTVWSTSGEDGILVGRALIADDGYYHYCMSLLSPEQTDSAEVYEDLVSTFTIRETDIEK